MTKRELLKAIWQCKAREIELDSDCNLNRWYWRLWYCLKCAICVVLGRHGSHLDSDMVWSIANWNHTAIDYGSRYICSCNALDVGYGVFTGWHYDAYELEY
jgi:hypothetical protein